MASGRWGHGEVTQSNHASTTSSVAVALAAVARCHDRRSAKWPVLPSAMASMTSNPVQAML